MSYIFVGIIFILLIDFIFQTFYFKRIFGQGPLEIKTFDGSNQPYHPSVYFFKKGWNGFQYWMVLTPYPMHVVYKDRWECPCIYCSNDGIRWNAPNQFINPLDDLTIEEMEHKDFFSDPHLVVNSNKLECWYRLTDRKRDKTFILRRISKDGKLWSEREILIDPEEEHIIDTIGDMVRSPAIIFQEMYKMWYVDNKKNVGQRNLCFSTSADGEKWERRQLCTLLGYTTNPWHIDVSFINGVYYLIVYDLDKLTLWKSKDGIQFSFIKILLSPNLKYGSFYSDGLYRSCLVWNQSVYLCYFSAFDHKSTYIGLMQGKDIEHMEIISCKKMRYKLSDYIYTILR